MQATAGQVRPRVFRKLSIGPRVLAKGRFSPARSMPSWGRRNSQCQSGRETPLTTPHSAQPLLPAPHGLRVRLFCSVHYFHQVYPRARGVSLPDRRDGEISSPGSPSASAAFQPPAGPAAQRGRALIPLLARRGKGVLLRLDLGTLQQLCEAPIPENSRVGAALAPEMGGADAGRVTTGSAPALRERLQAKINAFLRPTAPLQGGRDPHPHSEPPRGPVHPEVNPKFSAQTGSQGDSCVHG